MTYKLPIILVATFRNNSKSKKVEKTFFLTEQEKYSGNLFQLFDSFDFSAWWVATDLKLMPDTFFKNVK